MQRWLEEFDSREMFLLQRVNPRTIATSAELAYFRVFLALDAAEYDPTRTMYARMVYITNFLRRWDNAWETRFGVGAQPAENPNM
ncbi:MAG: hypothetical protein LQ340_001205 [Diploschistes diacapsis]|nr:MAG: hypothetical protein LQ340_001205 [Diploschistes diacapsis]